MKYLLYFLIFILTFSAGLSLSHTPAEPHKLCYEQLKLAPMEMDADDTEWQKYEAE
jgi:hypothetical protein